MSSLNQCTGCRDEGGVCEQVSGGEYWACDVARHVPEQTRAAGPGGWRRRTSCSQHIHHPAPTGHPPPRGSAAWLLPPPRRLWDSKYLGVMIWNEIIKQFWKRKINFLEQKCFDLLHNLVVIIHWKTVHWKADPWKVRLLVILRCQLNERQSGLGRRMNSARLTRLLWGTVLTFE